VAPRRKGTRPGAGEGPVRLDYTGCLQEAIGPSGLTRDELAAAFALGDEARRRLRQAKGAGRLGFDAILDDDAPVAASLREGRRLSRLADTLVVDGIGGSALGALALQTALRPRRRLVVLDNVDPEGVAAKLDGLDPRRTAVNVITKSGSTAETMANLLVLLGWMRRKLGPRHVARWSATTDPKKGDLRAVAERLGIPMLPVPDNVGGRFSVLTPVGLVPAAFLGIDVEALVRGARDMRRRCWSRPADKNPGVVGAALLHALSTTRGRAMQVLMPYADALLHLADWYRQLWAESLGKRLDRRGRLVQTGQTPVVSMGATDQHSQVQLYMEGPHDKVVTFLEVERFRRDVKIPRLHADLASLGYLGGRTLGELIAAERRGTEVALTTAGRPNFTWRLPEISPHVLGQLIYLFEFQTALAGELYDIDAFDQPGVEAGKIATYALMGRAGYEEHAARLRRPSGARKAVV
jgi:glucose-6-phosphate isomerase